MDDQSPRTVWTVPTELERQDAFMDMALLAMTVLGTWWLILQGLGWWSAPLVLLVAVGVLSGEPATDVKVVGVLATGLRSKLGLRRAHEWVLAWEHYHRWMPRFWFWVRFGCPECHALGRRTGHGVPA